MTIVQGKILAGEIIGSRVSRKIIVTPDFPFVDESTNEPSIVILPFEESINDDGRFVIEVPQSESVVKDAGSQAGITESVTYEWKIVENFTEVIEEEEVAKENEIFKIHAICPDDDIVDFSTLVAIPSHGSWLGIGVRRIANVLTDPSQPYLDQLSFQLNSRGGFDESISYAQRDLVSYQGGSYFWRPSTPSDTPTPIPGESEEWQLVSERGETGAGTTANLDGYNPETWEGSNEAAARGDVVEALSTFEFDSDEYLTVDDGAPKQNPTFIGNVKRGSPVVAIPGTAPEDREIIDFGYLRDYVASSSSSAFPRPIIYLKRTPRLALPRVGTSQKITWDAVNDSTIDSEGIYSPGNATVTLSPGFYLMIMSIRIRMGTGFGYTSNRFIPSTFVSTSPGNDILGHFNKSDQNGSSSVRELLMQGFVLRQINTTQDLIFSVLIEGNAYSDGGEIMSQSTNNFLAIWRIS